MSENKGFPPWAWIGCGCVGAIAALVAIAVGLGFWGVNKAREFGELMKDPEEREERALSALGASELPDGYYAVVAFSVPFVFDFAMLADEPPKENGEPVMGEHGFIFVSFPAFGDGDEELYDFFEGRSEDVGALRRENMGGRDHHVDHGRHLAMGYRHRDRDVPDNRMRVLEIHHDRSGELLNAEPGGESQAPHHRQQPRARHRPVPPLAIAIVSSAASIRLT